MRSGGDWAEWEEGWGKEEEGTADGLFDRAAAAAAREKFSGGEWI